MAAGPYVMDPGRAVGVADAVVLGGVDCCTLVFRSSEDSWSHLRVISKPSTETIFGIKWTFYTTIISDKYL